MKYRMIRIEDYKDEPIQYAGYYVLRVTKDMPKPDVLFVEDDEKGDQ